MSKVRDPVCGMVIEDGSAVGREVYGERTVYFCSKACQKTYLRSHPPE